MRWKAILASAVIGAVGLLLVQPASALPTFEFNAKNTIFFANGEVICTPVAGGGCNVKPSVNVAVGDIVYGVLRADTIESNGTPVWSADNVGGPGGSIDTLTGYFVHSIVATFNVPLPGGGIGLVAVAGPAPFDPNGKLTAAELGAGAMLKLWVDSGPTPPATAPTFGAINGGAAGRAASMAAMTDGVHYATLGMAPAGGGGPGYWYSLFSSPTAGNGFMGLNTVINNTGLTLLPIDDPAEPPFGVPRPPVNPVQFYAQTELIIGSTDCGSWSTAAGIGMCSNDPATIFVPEPGSMLLLGLGALGLGAWVRRRTK